MPRKATIPPLTPGQAKFILEQLVNDGTVTAADVRRVLATMWQEMTTLERRIEELRAAVHSVAMQRSERTVTKVKKAALKAISAKRAESMRLQGKYLSLLLKTREGARAKFAKIAKERGRTAAISEMEKAFRNVVV
jgi:hypothetical protein